MRGLVVVNVAALVLAFLAIGSAQEAGKKDKEPVPKKPGILTVTNADGKEMSLTKWKIIQGTRMIAGEPEAAKPTGKDEKPVIRWPAGQEYLEFREDNSTDYKEGILTLVPMNSVCKAVYDDMTKTVDVTFLDAEGKEVVLKGTTKYTGINKLIMDVTVEVGDLGPSNVKLQGGMLKVKPMIHSFQFPSPQPAPKPSGSRAVIVGVDKGKSVHKVQDLKALYRTGGVNRISSSLLFKKDARIEVAKMVKFRKAPPEKGKKELLPEYEVTLADGKQFNLLLVKDVFPDNGLPAQFLGLIGKVPAGYKLFPLHTLVEMHKEE